jgi:hypothetical protein
VEAGAVDGPALTELAFTATGSTESALVPRFAPGVHDYYVKCAEGATSYDVVARAASGATAALAIETPAKPMGSLAPTGTAAPRQSSSVSLHADQALVVSATEGTSTEEYWVRCLPPDFTAMRWLPHGGCEPSLGYYLVGNEQAARPDGAFAMVLDTHGVPVWYARVENGVYNVDSIVPGSISFIPWPVNTGWRFDEIDPASTSTLAPKGLTPNPHDIRPLPNGHFMMFSAELQPGVDLTGYDVPLPDGGLDRLGPNSTIIPCDVLEVDSSGKVLWTWTGTDHLDPVKDNTHPQLLNKGTAEVPDPFHCNSIDVDPESGDLLISSRQEDSVFYIDRATSKILWKMGGSSFTRDGAAYIPLPGSEAFITQHDARLRPGWSLTCGGQITVFDDETLGIPARAAIYDVTLDGTGSDGKRCGPRAARRVWQWEGKTSSSGMGSFRIAPDGSKLIGWGQGGVPGLIFTELDAHSDDVLDLYFTDDSASYRAIKLPPSAFDLSVLRNSAGLSPR